MDLPRPARKAFEKVQNIVKIDLKYALSGGFFLSLNQGTSAIIGLLLTVAFANLLPVETYGTYRYILAAYSLIAIAALPGIDTAVLQSISRHKEGTWALGIKTKMRWSLIGTAGSLIYAAYLYAHGSPIMSMLFALIAIALPFMESFGLYSTFVNGRRLFGVWTTIEILTQAVSAATLVTTMFLTKNVALLMAGYFIPYIVMRIGATLYLMRRYKPNNEQDPGLFSYGKEMTVFQILSRMISSADQIVLYHFLGPAQVAIFSLATAVPNRVQSLFRISGTLAFPKFAQRTPREIAESLPRKMALFVVAILIICGVYILLAPLMFTYVFPKYLPSLAFSQVAIFYTLSAITYPFGSYLAAHKKVRDNYIMAIGTFIPKILCLVILVPRIGVWGAVIGLLVTSLFTILLTIYILFRDSRTARTA